MDTRNQTLAVGVMLSSLLLFACGGTQNSDAKHLPTCKEHPVEIFLEGKARLNPNAKGQPMPVEVRIFLLKTRQTFDQLDFETIWRGGEKALAADLVNSVYITIYPGKLKIYPVQVPITVGYVAMVAIFRRPMGRKWQHVVRLGDPVRRCGRDLHTMVHATLFDNTITAPERVRVPGGRSDL